MAEKYKKVYAVDFDGTLCRGTRFPKIGTPNFYLFEFLKEKQRKGYIICGRAERKNCWKKQSNFAKNLV